MASAYYSRLILMKYLVLLISVIALVGCKKLTPEQQKEEFKTLIKNYFVKLNAEEGDRRIQYQEWYYGSEGWYPKQPLSKVSPPLRTAKPDDIEPPASMTNSYLYDDEGFILILKCKNKPMSEGVKENFNNKFPEVADKITCGYYTVLTHMDIAAMKDLFKQMKEKPPTTGKGPTSEFMCPKCHQTIFRVDMKVADITSENIAVKADVQKIAMLEMEEPTEEGCRAKVRYVRYQHAFDPIGNAYRLVTEEGAEAKKYERIPPPYTRIVEKIIVEQEFEYKKRSIKAGEAKEFYPGAEYKLPSKEVTTEQKPPQKQ